LFAGLGAASLTFMFGLPTYALIYVLPGINQLNSPFRWMYGVTVAVALLAAFGADAVPRSRYLARILGWGLLATGATMAAGLALSRLTFDLWSPIAAPILLGMEKAAAAFSDFGMFYSYIFPQVAILAAVTFGSGWIILRLRGDNARVRPVHIAAVVLLAFDLMAASWGFNAASNPALLDYVRRYQQRAGITIFTGNEVRTGDYRSGGAAALIDGPFTGQGDISTLIPGNGSPEPGHGGSS
jgi:hypothetical protein